MTQLTHPSLDDLKLRSAYYDMKLKESTFNLYTDLGLLDPRDLRAEYEGFSYAQYPSPVYYRSQKRGEIVSVALNEEALFRIRDRSRKLCVENEFAICGSENRINYVVGEGLVYTANPLPGCPKGLAEKVQQVIDLFAEANDLPELEADCLARLDREGEFFLRLFEMDSGLLAVRTIEPEHVRAPQGASYDDRHSWGVETLPGDVETPVGYWVIEDPVQHPVPHFVPHNEIIHVKANTPRNAKRGLPLYYPVEANLRRAEDLLASMTSMAKTRAKIAVIRKFQGITKSAANNLIDSLTDATVTDQATASTQSLERWRYGTILNSSGNVDWEFPSGDVAAGDYVNVLEAEIRSVAARLVMPSWMLLTSATDANYASALVAEAPSTRMFLRLQRLFRSRFGEHRVPGPKLSLLWRQIRFAVRCGLLPPEVVRCVKIQAEAPSLIVRDHSAEAQTNNTYNQMRVKSVQTIQQELGLDPEQEDRNFQESEAKQPKQNAGGMDPMTALMGGDAGGDPDAGGVPDDPLVDPGEVTPDVDFPTALSEALSQCYFTGSVAPASGGVWYFDHGLRSTSGPVVPTLTLALVESVDHSRPLWEAVLHEAGFTGTITDKIGRKFHYVNGKRVKGNHYQQQKDAGNLANVHHLSSGQKHSIKAHTQHRQARAAQAAALKAHRQANRLLVGSGRAVDRAEMAVNTASAQLAKLKTKHQEAAKAAKSAKATKATKAKAVKAEAAYLRGKAKLSAAKQALAAAKKQKALAVRLVKHHDKHLDKANKKFEHTRSKIEQLQQPPAAKPPQAEKAKPAAPKAEPAKEKTAPASKPTTPTPQAPAAPAAKGTSFSNSNEQEKLGTMVDAWVRIHKKKLTTGGIVSTPELKDEMLQTFPDMTDEEFGQFLVSGYNQEKWELQAADPRFETRAQEMPQFRHGSAGYIVVPDSLHGAARHKPAQPKARVAPEAPAAAEKKSTTSFGTAEPQHQMRSAIQSAIKTMNSNPGSLLLLPEWEDKMREEFPDMTREEFHKFLEEGHKKDLWTLQLFNDPNLYARSNEGIYTKRGILLSVMLPQATVDAYRSKAPTAKPPSPSPTPPAAKEPPKTPPPPPAAPPAPAATEPSDDKPSEPERNQVKKTVADALSRDEFNFMHMADLKKKLPAMSLEKFHAVIQELRRSGAITMSAYEGRNPQTEDRLAAGIEEGDSLMLYVIVTNQDLLNPTPAPKPAEPAKPAPAASASPPSPPQAAPASGPLPDGQKYVMEMWGRHLKAPNGTEKLTKEQAQEMSENLAKNLASMPPEHLKQALTILGKNSIDEVKQAMATHAVGAAPPPPPPRRGFPPTIPAPTQPEKQPAKGSAKPAQPTPDERAKELADWEERNRQLHAEKERKALERQAQQQQQQEEEVKPNESLPEKTGGRGDNYQISKYVDYKLRQSGLHFEKEYQNQSPNKKRYNKQEFFDALVSSLNDGFGTVGRNFYSDSYGDDGSAAPYTVGDAFYSDPPSPPKVLNANKTKIANHLAQYAGQRVAIHKIRDQFPEMSRRDFDDAVRDLVTSNRDQFRSIAINDSLNVTREEMLKSIPSIRETMFTIEVADTPGKN